MCLALTSYFTVAIYRYLRGLRECSFEFEHIVFIFIGFLVDKDGFVLKMVDFTKSGSTGFIETAFFESVFNADSTDVDLVEVRKFLPSYHGLQQLSINGDHCILHVLKLVISFLCISFNELSPYHWFALFI